MSTDGDSPQHVERKRNGAVVALVVGIAALLQVALLSQYSNGPEAIILVPMAVACYVGIGMVAGTAALHTKRPWQLACVVAVALGAAMSAVSALHPTDGGMKPHQFLRQLAQAGEKWSEIAPVDVYAEGDAGRALRRLARWKFAESSPEDVILVGYYAPGVTSWDERARFACEKRNGAWGVVELKARGHRLGVVERPSERWPQLVFNVDGAEFPAEFSPELGLSATWHLIDSRWRKGEPRLDIGPSRP